MNNLKRISSAKVRPSQQRSAAARRVLNSPRTRRPQGFLEGFSSDTAGASAAERAKLFAPAVRDLHSGLAAQGQTDAPAANADLDFHFVSLVVVGGRLFELDGNNDGPIDTGIAVDSTDAFLPVRRAPRAADCLPLAAAYGVTRDCCTNCVRLGPPHRSCAAHRFALHWLSPLLTAPHRSSAAHRAPLSSLDLAQMTPAARCLPLPTTYRYRRRWSTSRKSTLHPSPIRTFP